MNLRTIQRQEIAEALRRLNDGELSWQTARFARRALGLTAGDLADITNVHERDVDDIERHGLTQRAALPLRLLLQLASDIIGL